MHENVLRYEWVSEFVPVSLVILYMEKNVVSYEVKISLLLYSRVFFNKKKRNENKT
jgi:hypothetical protein